jgi:transcriptional regulator with XRE-family HTH domain
MIWDGMKEPGGTLHINDKPGDGERAGIPGHQRSKMPRLCQENEAGYGCEAMNDLGTAIRKHRQEFGIDITTLAHRVEKSRQYVGDCEHGNRVPTLKTLEKIESVLGLNAGTLILASPHASEWVGRALASDPVFCELATMYGQLEAGKQIMARESIRDLLNGPWSGQERRKIA